jgi:murein DD-endopeptidase MepM/ murein hydrolase activator NlpD
MKFVKLLALPALMTIAFTAFASPAMAVNTDMPGSSIDSASACIDTSYQIQNFLSTQKIVYPESNSSITSPYGNRVGVNPQLSSLLPELHTGTDWALGKGTPIYAAASGTVVRAGTEIVGDGQIIVIEHNINGQKWTTMYLHVMNATEKVKQGDKVMAGQQIAREGATGNVTGAHLHFEVWEGEYLKGKSTDPATWLKANGAVDASNKSVPNFTCNKGTVFDGKIAAWDGVKNGEIHADKLSPVSFNPKYQLEKTAEAKLTEMNTDFKAKFNRNIPVIEGYKDLETQKSDAQNVSGSPLPGLSNYGWAKAVTLYYSNPEGGIKPLTDISKYDPFDDIEYKWLLENAPKYGWINPVINHKENLEPKADRFIFVGADEATRQPSKEDLQKYARATMTTYNWTDKEAQCLADKWDKTSNWNPALVNGDSVGIAQASMVVKYGADWKTNPESKRYMESPRMQINDGLKTIKDSGKTPCE